MDKNQSILCSAFLGKIEKNETLLVERVAGKIGMTGMGVRRNKGRSQGRARETPDMGYMEFKSPIAARTIPVPAAISRISAATRT